MPSVTSIEDAALFPALLRVIVVGDAEEGSPERTAKVPCAAKVILAARAADAGLGLAVYKEVIVSLAPPAIGVRHDRDKCAHKVASALGFADSQVFADRRREVGAVLRMEV